MTINIIGGGYQEPGNTELDDAIEQILDPYIPDSILRIELTKRILTEVEKRTPVRAMDRPT